MTMKLLSDFRAWLKTSWTSYQLTRRIRRVTKGMRISDYVYGNHPPLSPERAAQVERISREALQSYIDQERAKGRTDI